MKASMMLVDSVQAIEGKLFILGGGWNTTGPDPTPFGIAILLKIPWDEANRRHTFELQLVDEDGGAVVVPEPTAGPLLIAGEFEVGRPAGVRPGTDLPVPLAINVGPLPLEPGRRYRWQLRINGKTDDDWTAAFDVRPAAW